MARGTHVSLDAAGCEGAIVTSDSRGRWCSIVLSARWVTSCLCAQASGTGSCTSFWGEQT